MARIPIFIIHGVGDYVDIDDKGIAHNADWFATVKKSIRNAYESYDHLKANKFDDIVDLVDIHYDEEFEKIINVWETMRDKLTQGMAQNTTEHRAVTQAVKVLDGILDEDNPKLRTHIVDLVLYEFVQFVREAVKNSVALQIRTKLLSTQSRWRGEWHVIGHSMGTAVAHDTLHGMFTDGNFGVKDCWCGTLMMVANCSRLLEDWFKPEWDVYKSLVKPQLLAGNTALNTYINVRHEFDPVAMPRAFAPDASWVDPTTLAKRYVPITFNDSRSRDIHAFENYFENPEVHIPFFRSVFGQGSITQAEADAAIASYRAQTIPGAFDDLRDELKKLSMAEGANWKEIIEKLVKFRMVVDKFVRSP